VAEDEDDESVTKLGTLQYMNVAAVMEIGKTKPIS
jgi:hypothetical protein